MPVVVTSVHDTDDFTTAESHVSIPFAVASPVPETTNKLLFAVSLTIRALFVLLSFLSKPLY